MRKKLPWPEILITALVIVLGAGIYLYAHKDEGTLEASKDRGAAIVEALEAYNAEHGTYPGQLEELVPAHVPAIEQPDWGLRRWRYRRYTQADVNETSDTADVYFQLSVAADESGYPVLYYDIAAQRWVLNN